MAMPAYGIQATFSVGSSMVHFHIMFMVIAFLICNHFLLVLTRFSISLGKLFTSKTILLLCRSVISMVDFCAGWWKLSVFKYRYICVTSLKHCDQMFRLKKRGIIKVRVWNVNGLNRKLENKK